MSTNRTKLLNSAQRIVIKVGSSSLTKADGHLNHEALAALVDVLAGLADQGKTVTLVSSGAQAAAMGPLQLAKKPKTLALAQAAASVGQGLLIAEYTRVFGSRGYQVGQVLLTAEDLLRRSLYRNARRALEELFTLGVVPVINENDTVATDEIKFGDNDRLAALVAHLVRADLLVLLTDVDGLYDKHPAEPDAKRISYVDDFSQVEHLEISASGSTFGTGGMVTKIAAASVASSSGIPVLLTAAASAPEAFDGEEVGTLFAATGKRLAARQLWLAYAADVAGQIVIDAGAARAITQRKASLLPAGVTGFKGDFQEGEVLEIVNETGKVLARGVAGFSSGQIDLVKGRSMAEIEFQTGLQYAHEVVHRDELVLTTEHRRS